MPRSRAWYPPERKTQTKHAIVPTKPSESPTSSFANTVVQGFGFGLGSSIAHTAVGSVAKSLTSNGSLPVHTPKPECEDYRRAFDACLLDTSCSNETARTMWIDVKKYCEKQTL